MLSVLVQFRILTKLCVIMQRKCLLVIQMLFGSELSNTVMPMLRLTSKKVGTCQGSYWVSGQLGSETLKGCFLMSY